MPGKRKSEMKVSKRNFVKGFFMVVAILALVRLVFPNVAKPISSSSSSADSVDVVVSGHDTASTRGAGLSMSDGSPARSGDLGKASISSSSISTGRKLFFNADGSLARHPIFSVHDFGKTFPDQNDVQLQSAVSLGVPPIDNRDQAESMKGKLVYVGSNPYFCVERLRSSVPYLVPRAAILLQDIGQSFFDSLQVKSIPLHKIIVTSVMRSKEDVAHLRSHNGNATQNSCHMYGTTFDVSYNRYLTVEASDVPRRRVRNDSLKWVLSEVLRDMRERGRCYIKYEVKQGCFHITVR